MQNLDFDLDNTIQTNAKAVNKFMLKFREIYTEFVKLKGIDVIKVLNIKNPAKHLLKTRAESRAYVNYYKTSAEISDDIRKQMLTEYAKSIENNYKNIVNFSTKINPYKIVKTPFEILNFDKLSSVQEKVIQHVDKLPYFGAYAYSCSCGAGKTMAGLYIMQQVKRQTIIISSRNAVNDQWKTTIFTLYPQLKIYENIDNSDGDIYILTPQYICRHFENIGLKPGLIIYDEVHSMLATKYLQSLLLPLYMVNQKQLKELPYMIALSATYPNENTLAYGYICKLFGKPVICESSITDIPVYIYDNYDHYDYIKQGENIRHTYFDKHYPKLDDITALKNALDKIDNHEFDNYNIDIHDTRYKGIVMTYNIHTSLLAARLIHDKYNINVLLVRTNNKPAVLFESNKVYDYSKLGSKTSLMDIINNDDEILNLNQYNEDKDEDLDEDIISIDTNDLIKAGIGIKYDYSYLGFDNISIIVSTAQRLKEGFSCQYLTWGICTKFVWSYISRVQLVGRIRRNSSDPDLNNHRRLLICYGGPRPSTINIPRSFRKKAPKKWLYDLNYEAKLFLKENYIRI